MKIMIEGTSLDLPVGHGGRRKGEILGNCENGGNNINQKRNVVCKCNLYISICICIYYLTNHEFNFLHFKKFYTIIKL